MSSARQEREYLADAEWHVYEAEVLVSDQREFVLSILQRGQDARCAEMLLEFYEERLSRWRAYRDEISRRLQPS